MTASIIQFAAVAGVLALILAAAFGYAYYQLRLSYREAMREAERRTREYQLLTQIGQAITSRLDFDAILQTIHKELANLFEVETFYIAFIEGEEVRFEYQVMEGVLQEKRTRKVTNAVTEHIVRTGQPLLIPSDMNKARARLGLVPTGKGAKCYCGVPILLSGKPAGVMAALSYEREFAYNASDVEVMQTAAGQVAVAIENSRLFKQEQRRAHYLQFLNSVSTSAISSQDPELMLGDIMGEIRRNFSYDHIGIGVLDYTTKEIEIKAGAGTAEVGVPRRFPLSFGIIGRVARTSETVIVQKLTGKEMSQTIVEGAKSVLCIPLSYGETLLGVLNVESTRENAFVPQEILTFKTLADLLATALHNAFVFKQMQQQSITDSLTGIKTRRYFLEALDAEWQRATRNGRPFSVALMDLDSFKAVNDTFGHLEGDLILARVARLLEQKCRHSNIVARYGGDEFVILMPETNVEQAQALAERLRIWLATDPMLAAHNLSGSFGLASFPIHGTTAEEILRVADAGMYSSKRQGGNRVSTVQGFGESEDTVLRRQLLSAYVQGFVHREHTGPQSVEELISTLSKVGTEVKEAREPLMSAIDALTRAVETREVHSAGHGDFVAKYAEAIARELNLSDAELADLTCAARVHDVGKIIVPESILCKPEPLTNEEFALVKMHTTLGARILETVPGAEGVARIVRFHHERFDGRGYPDGLKGDDIPIGARIINVADAYVNMISDRPFSPARDASAAARELEANSGTQFDGLIVRMFLRHLQQDKAASQKL